MKKYFCVFKSRFNRFCPTFHLVFTLMTPWLLAGINEIHTLQWRNQCVVFLVIMQVRNRLGFSTLRRHFRYYTEWGKVVGISTPTWQWSQGLGSSGINRIQTYIKKTSCHLCINIPCNSKSPQRKEKKIYRTTVSN